MSGEQVPYDRAVLADVLVYHYRRDMRSCGCGWAELGRSHPEHVATVYEESVGARTPVFEPDWSPAPHDPGTADAARSQP